MKKRSTGKKASSKQRKGGKRQSVKKKSKAPGKEMSSGLFAMISSDHDLLRESISILTGKERETLQMQRHLERFLGFLEMHAKAEEASLYSTLLRKDEVKKDVLEALEEHGIAEYLLRELQGSGYQEQWSDEIGARAKVLAELIEHHVEEEEREFFPKVRKALSQQELAQVGETYQAKREELRPEFDDMDLQADRRKSKTAPQPQV